MFNFSFRLTKVLRTVSNDRESVLFEPPVLWTRKRTLFPPHHKHCRSRLSILDIFLVFDSPSRLEFPAHSAEDDCDGRMKHDDSPPSRRVIVRAAIRLDLLEFSGRSRPERVEI